MSHEAEGNESSLAAQLPQIFLLPIINYHPVLFSFYSLFQDVSGIYSLLGATVLETVSWALSFSANISKFWQLTQHLIGGGGLS